MKICCLIVTYNRKNLLCRCIKQCLAQSINPDVLVYDNASTDGTYDALMAEGLLNDSRVIYYKSEINGGGAGGFSEGMRQAVELGYDYIWLMDDDGYPRNDDSLSECIKVCQLHDNKAIVNAFVYAEDDKLSFKLGRCETVTEADRKFKSKEIMDYIAPFNGTLIPAQIPKEIGYPRKDFFIKGDEYEYVTRAKVNGYALMTARNGEFYHPRFVVKKRKFLWKEIVINDEPAWKEYCRARNHAYINRKYFGKAALMRHYMVTFVKSFYFVSDKKKKRAAIKQAFKDEKRNYFSNEQVKKFW